MALNHTRRLVTLASVDWQVHGRGGHQNGSMDSARGTMCRPQGRSHDLCRRSLFRTGRGPTKDHVWQSHVWRGVSLVIFPCSRSYSSKFTHIQILPARCMNASMHSAVFAIHPTTTHPSALPINLKPPSIHHTHFCALCSSGQSNMVMSVAAATSGGIYASDPAMLQRTWPTIRLFDTVSTLNHPPWAVNKSEPQRDLWPYEHFPVVEMNTRARLLNKDVHQCCVHVVFTVPIETIKHHCTHR